MSIPFPGPSSAGGFEVAERLSSELHEGDNFNNELFEQSTTQLLEHAEARKARKKGRSGKQKATKEQDEGEIDKVLEKMAKQGDELVAAVKRMEENSRMQTNALQEMSRSLGLFFARQGRQKNISNPSPRKKRPRREENSDDSDTF